MKTASNKRDGPYGIIARACQFQACMAAAGECAVARSGCEHKVAEDVDLSLPAGRQRRGRVHLHNDRRA